MGICHRSSNPDEPLISQSWITRRIKNSTLSTHLFLSTLKKNESFHSPCRTPWIFYFPIFFSIIDEKPCSNPQDNAGSLGLELSKWFVPGLVRRSEISLWILTFQSMPLLSLSTARSLCPLLLLSFICVSASSPRSVVFRFAGGPTATGCRLCPRTDRG